MLRMTTAARKTREKIHTPLLTRLYSHVFGFAGLG